MIGECRRAHRDRRPHGRASRLRRRPADLCRARVRIRRAASGPRRRQPREPQPGAVRQAGRARLSRRRHPGGIRRCGWDDRGRVRAHGGGLLRPAAGLRDHHHAYGRRGDSAPCLGGAQARAAPRDRFRPRARARVLGTGSGLGSRGTALSGSPPRRRLGDRRPEDMDLERDLRSARADAGPNRRRRQPRNHDAQRPDGQRRDRGSPDRDDGRTRGQRRVLHRRFRAGRLPGRRAGQRLAPAHGRTERRTAC